VTGRAKGKVAIVTGAARGLGLAISAALVDEGAKVTLTDILADQGAQVAGELGTDARFLAHDVAICAAPWSTARESAPWTSLSQRRSLRLRSTSPRMNRATAPARNSSSTGAGQPNRSLDLGMRKVYTRR
jgi:hypothetical protein